MSMIVMKMMIWNIGSTSNPMVKKDLMIALKTMTSSKKKKSMARDMVSIIVV